MIKSIKLVTFKMERIKFPKEKIIWSNSEQYPSCQSLDLYDFIEETKIPKTIWFRFNVLENLSAILFVEERNKATSRSLRIKRLIYNGPTMEIADLSKPSINEVVLSISQTIDSEQDKDKNCKNYPFQNFQSYRECDDLYVQNQLKRFDLIPFWATENYSSVTTFR